ncbi:hypothetical protein IEQ34_002322 [Dendrobium chrysotoxum]|uniref:Calcineurin-like phosphoesterase domain-containing protein n=1 Tax=Dendrobium chrysotoxum TaxID=161865 RepID=A0AAV7HLR7_DENCH|nr:hypothetical protein IEQ34_002322 [Dendrobium chrysotoxum]
MSKRTSLSYSFPVFLIVVATATTACLDAAGGGAGRGDGLGVGKGLRFSGSSPFRIALFADLHYGENAWDDWGPKQDVKSDRVLSNVLDNETPDFVIYLGDVITANNLPIPNASMYWVQAISPTRIRGIPWATLFGNHDDAQFEWPLEWFSIAGIPEVHCPPESSFAVPEWDYGLVLDEDDNIDILRSPFFDVGFDFDNTVEEYFDRIHITLVDTIDDQRTKGRWTILGRSTTASPPDTPPLRGYFTPTIPHPYHRPSSDYFPTTNLFRLSTSVCSHATLAICEMADSTSYSVVPYPNSTLSIPLCLAMDPEQLGRTLDLLVGQMNTISQQLKENQADLAEFRRTTTDRLDTIERGEKDCSFRGTARIELMKMEILKNPLSHSQIGPTELWPAVSNYILQISSSKDPESPSVFLYFLDSGGGSYPEVISYAQIKWFQEQSQAINPNSQVPELIFWHIPSHAYKKVAPCRKSSIKRPCVGSINMEEVASQEAEWGIMDALLNRSSVKAVFVGHNHGLDWCCPYKKLWLCFARHSGYGGYGTWPRGSRILEMTEDPFSLNSWISMEDGTKHSYVELCS